MRLGRHTIPTTFQHTWQYLLAEPCTWLFICFFQPNRFRTECERQGLVNRFVFMLRLALPLFLFTLPFAVALQMLLTGCFLACTSVGSSPIRIDGLLLTVQATVFGIACGIVAGVVGDAGLGIILSMALGMTGIVVGSTAIGFSRGIAIAAVLGLVGGTGRGLKWGIKGGIMGSLVGGLGWAIAWSLGRGTPAGALSGLLVAAMFLASYLVGYYRLLLYPVSGVSAFRTYRRSKKNPLRVFAYPHSSSLYWDECVFLPLPHLPQEAILLDPRWITPFARLSDASGEAARYCGPLSRQTRRHALEEMLTHLERIYPNTAFSDVKLNSLLGNVITTWRAAARYEQEKLEQGVARS
jgi:hypothetical protein